MRHMIENATDPSGAPARRYITNAEFKRLADAAGQAGRNAVRDKCLITMAYNHGLRASETVGLRWHDIDWTTENLHVRRMKNGTPATHPIPGSELRQLRALKREAEGAEGHMFRSERGGPLSADMVARIVARAGVIAGIGFHVHPHMLRHGCGYYLANKGVDTRTIQAYLGHSQISSTVIYTALAPGRFKDMFRD